MIQPESNGQTKKRGPGAPSKFTPEIRERILKLLRAGNYVNTSCYICGITTETLRAWRARGREDAEAGRESEFAVFFAAAARVIRESEEELVARIRQAGQGNERRVVKETHKQVLDHTGMPIVVRDGAGNPVLDADGRVQYLERIERTIEIEKVKDWRADAWSLQARHRQRYGRIEVRGKLRHEHVAISDEDKNVATRIAARRLAATATN